jgi:transposase InsO family protein
MSGTKGADSNTLDATVCIEALAAALDLGRPAIFNTDQGRQFTSEEFTPVLARDCVAVSMDGRGGRPTTCSSSATEADLNEGLAWWFDLYTHQRPHPTLGYRNGLRGLPRPRKAHPNDPITTTTRLPAALYFASAACPPFGSS